MEQALFMKNPSINQAKLYSRQLGLTYLSLLQCFTHSRREFEVTIELLFSSLENLKGFLDEAASQL